MFLAVRPLLARPLIRSRLRCRWSGWSGWRRSSARWLVTERFARAHRQCSRADDAAARVRRRLTWRFEEDGSLAGSFRLPPVPGAVLLKALRAVAGGLEPPGEGSDGGSGVSAETPPPVQADPAGPRPVPSTSAWPTSAVFNPGDWYDLLCEYFAERPGTGRSERIPLAEWLDRGASATDSPAAAA